MKLFLIEFVSIQLNRCSNWKKIGRDLSVLVKSIASTETLKMTGSSKHPVF